MELLSHGAITVLRSTLLDRFPGIGHAFSTRLGGVSEGTHASLNLTAMTGDARERALENRRRLCDAVGADFTRLTIPRQVLSPIVLDLRPQHVGGVTPEDADGLVTNIPGVPTLTLSADCVLVLLYDPVRHAIANVHSSRQGAFGRILPAAVARLRRSFGTASEDLVAAIGPSIGPCCYEVRPDIVDPWRREHGDRFLVVHDGRTTLDLWSTTRAQLEESGVRRENIDLAGICTRCRPDLLYSYRRDGDRSGRFGALLWIREGRA